MDNSWAHDNDHNLWLLISQTRHAIHKLRKNELSSYNISPVEAGVLSIVKTLKAKATPANISRLLIREPNAVSQLLSRMEKKGLVRKNYDLDKKNLVRIELTKKGVEKYQQSKENRKNVSDIMNTLSLEERQRLGSYLQILKITALKKLGIENVK